MAHRSFCWFCHATAQVKYVALCLKLPLVPYMSCLMTKPTKWLCAQRRLRSVWASAQSDQSSLSAWRKLGSLATRWVHSEDSDQTGRMPRLIWVFDGRQLLLVLSWGGSYCVSQQRMLWRDSANAWFDFNIFYCFKIYMYKQKGRATGSSNIT